jgi:hypothetical protein
LSPSGRQSQIAAGPYVSVRPYGWVTSIVTSISRRRSVVEGGVPPVVTRTGGEEALRDSGASEAARDSTVGAALRWVTPASATACQMMGV